MQELKRPVGRHDVLVWMMGTNLLSVSQLCKMGYNCLFTDIGVTVFRRSDDSVAFKGVLEGQLYQNLPSTADPPTLP